MYKSTLAVLFLAAARSVQAVGCATHTYGSCPDDNIVHWYDPDDGQICDPLDCGGGRAPAKTTEPCCTAAYTGTEVCVTTPSYLPCFTTSGASTSTASAVTTTAAIDSGKGGSTTIAAMTTVTPSIAINGISGYMESLTITGAATTVTGTAVATGGNSTTTASGTESSAASVVTNAAAGAGYAQNHPFVALAGAALGVVLL
ncbi:hypothetical protein G7054_g3482 [Neopestalotiopsis clavispora]|nr:hypothetical protein G7054_g3482 [Neopestalotiopsis clavispora]